MISSRSALWRYGVRIARIVLIGCLLVSTYRHASGLVLQAQGRDHLRDALVLPTPEPEEPQEESPAVWPPYAPAMAPELSRATLESWNCDYPPPLPAAFWGAVTLNGENVPAGTPITAWIDDVQVASTASQIHEGASVYNLDIPADDPCTAGRQGGDDGEMVRFQVGGVWANETGIWQSGAVVEKSLTGDGWVGRYYANANLTEPMTLTRIDSAIDFDWGNGSPDPSLPSDFFSVRWTRTLHFEAGTYTFHTLTDDGVRLYVDGQMVIDKWVAQASTEWTATVDLDGEHTVMMEYFERRYGAVAKLWWEEVPADGWMGQYYANTTLSEPATLTRIDSAIDFDWGNGSPAPSLPNDFFSVRWTRTLSFEAGTYIFHTLTDDGVRLYVDGQMVIDKWVAQAPTEWTATVDLNGEHTIVMEYFERRYGAVAKLWWEVIPEEGWTGEYYANATLSEPATLTRIDSAIDFDWGNGSPAPSLPSDFFSVRWTRTLPFEAGTYTFHTLTDDGVRLYVDGQMVIDKWVAQAPTEWTATVALDGEHTIVMEYFERRYGAVAKLWWEEVPADGWMGQYYANTTLTEPATLTRTDSAIDFDWGNGSPDPSLPSDFFSVRWTRTLSFEAGTYTFHTLTDDGVRLYVDGQMVIDKWVAQAATEWTATVDLNGEHTVVMEYFERRYDAVAKLWWDRLP